MATEKKTRKKSTEQQKAKGFAWKEYTDPMEAKAAMDAYFDQCDETGELYGEAGLSLALKISLKTLREWKDNAEHAFHDAAEYGYLRIIAAVDQKEEYRNKAMVAKAINLCKQDRFLAYQDKPTENKSIDIHVKFGPGTESSDFD